VKEIAIRANFEGGSEMPLWFMNGGELMWLEDTLIFLDSLILACWFLEI
jgi:hypothetical protein